MDEQTASIYGLKDRRDDEPFYIGMSVNPYVRYGQHLAFPNGTAKSDRILDMQKDGLLPELIILEKDLPVSEASEREGYWIRHYLALGVPLTNKTKLVVPKARASRSNVYTYTPRHRQSVLRLLGIKPIKDGVSAKEAARILAWRAKEELGIDRQYTPSTLYYHVKQGNIKVYPKNARQSRKDLYTVTEVFELRIAG